MLARSPTFWLRLAPALGALVSLTVFQFDFFMDDLLQLAVVQGLWDGPRGQWELFTFGAGDASIMRPYLENGPMPWWTLPELRLAFFRPLASLLAHFDVWAFGQNAALFKLHSIAWYAALIAAFASVARRTLALPVAALAAVLFAVDDVHWMPVAWWANRNALVATLPTVLGLGAYVRWAQDGWKPGAWLAPMGLAVGLCGGEMALSSLAYPVAFEVFASRDEFKKRALRLAPLFAVVAVWAGLYRTWGFGAYGSGIYVDPGASPLTYLSLAFPRAMALASSQFFALSSDLWLAVPALHPVYLLLGLAASAGVVAGLVWLKGRVDPQEHRHVVAWSAGATLAVMPQLATFPTDRLLLMPSLGAAVWVASMLHALSKETAKAPRWVRGALITLHLVLPLGPWLLNPRALGKISSLHNHAVAAAFATPRPTSDRVVIVNAPDPVVAFYSDFARSYLGLGRASTQWALSFAPYDHRLTRVSDRALELEVLGGRMLESVFEQLVRSPDFPLPVGHTTTFKGLSVEVLEVAGGLPTRIRATFDAPLESHDFLTFAHGVLTPLTLPELSKSIVLPKQQSLIDAALDPRGSDN